MQLIIAFIVITIILIVPIKIAASMVGARRTGIFHCFIAIVLAALLQGAAARLIPGISEMLGVLLALPLAAVAYMLILDTTFFKSLGIAIIQGVVTVAVLFGLAFLFTAV